METRRLIIRCRRWMSRAGRDRRTGDAAWLAGALVHIGRTVAVCAFVGAGILGALSWRLVTIRNELLEGAARDRFRAKRLAVVADFDSAREKLVETVADEMRRSRVDEESVDARSVATLIVRAAEKYPLVDPVLFASVGIVGYARSDAGLGLDPEVASRIAQELGWSYDASLRTDIEKSADLAARHLGQLQAAYTDWAMVLAEYNGGPLDAAYLRARVGKLSSETKSYVEEVLEMHQRLASRLTGETKELRDDEWRRSPHPERTPPTRSR